MRSIICLFMALFIAPNFFEHCFAVPILSTDKPPFPIKPCPGRSEAVPFEPVPQKLQNGGALLEAFLSSQNPEYATPHIRTAQGSTQYFPSFSGIGPLYEKWCSAYGVRWDWAFVQMLHETNFLRYTGSVLPDSFNFAGLAAVHETSGGEHFPSIERGVKAHCQHLAAYALLDLPERKCGPTEQDNQNCLEADRTLSVMGKVIRPNVCKQYGRPAQFDELGPDDVGPCSERQVRIRGTIAREKLCPNDIVRWASGPLATDYSATLARIYSQFSEKLAKCELGSSGHAVEGPELDCRRTDKMRPFSEEQVAHCLPKNYSEAAQIIICIGTRP